MVDIDKLEAEVLALPAEVRASLAYRLLASLEEVSEADFERLWGDESALRAAEVDAGTVQTVPAEDVARKARALLR